MASTKKQEKASKKYYDSHKKYREKKIEKQTAKIMLFFCIISANNCKALQISAEVIKICSRSFKKLLQIAEEVFIFRLRGFESSPEKL